MLRFQVFDKSLTRVGWVTAPLSARVIVRHNQPGTAELTVDADTPEAADLAGKGARCVIDYRPEGGEWMTVMSGLVRERTGEGHAAAATRTFTVQDDKRLLWNLLGWPAPAQPISNQGAESAYWKRSGPAETVLKAAVAANAHRYNLPVTIAPDLGRGGNVAVSLRFHPLADRLFPAVDLAGVGVTVLLQGGGLVVDCYEQGAVAQTLTEESGVVQGERSRFGEANPTNTRVIVGAGGEDVLRLFRQYVDTAREAEWGDMVEVFRDARDIDPDLAEEPDRDALMLERANETLAEGAATANLNLELAETGWFRFGDAVHLGDKVSVKLAGSPVLTDVVREVEITWDASDGLTVVPRVGDRAHDPENPDRALARWIAQALRQIRDLQAGR